jgi:toxin ParE1/3/4
LSHRFFLSPAAQKDVEQIWDYTADRWGTDQAEHYLRDLQQAIERAAVNPPIGRSCEEVRSGYRKLPAGSHVVFYRQIDDGAIDVVRIPHQRMDIDRHL